MQRKIELVPEMTNAICSGRLCEKNQGSDGELLQGATDKRRVN
jgi:hypothetical protein